MAATATVKLGQLRAFRAEIMAGMQHKAGPFRDAFVQWGERYRAAMQKRFIAFSRGGGGWPDLAQSTKLARMHGRRMAKAALKGKRTRRLKRGRGMAKLVGRKFAILRDTGTLFNALAPKFIDAPGQLQANIPYGIVVGIGGPGMMADGKATIADIASYHQAGGGHLPKREIIVDVPPQVRAAMIKDMRLALNSAARIAGLKR